MGWPRCARAEPALEACEAEADDGGHRGDGYSQGYDHGRCRGTDCDDGGRYARYEEGYHAGYDASQPVYDVQDDLSEYDGGDENDPERYKQWYYNEF